MTNSPSTTATEELLERMRGEASAALSRASVYRQSGDKAEATYWEREGTALCNRVVELSFPLLMPHIREGGPEILDLIRFNSLQDDIEGMAARKLLQLIKEGEGV